MSTKHQSYRDKWFARSLRENYSVFVSEEQITIPILHRVAADRGLVVLGGQIKTDKLQFLQKHLGKKNVEWIGTEGTGSLRAVEYLALRVRNGGVGAVIFLDGLIGHRHYSPVLNAARAAGVPVGYGGKAGKSSLAQAMTEIEAELSGAPRIRHNPTRAAYVVCVVRRGKERVVSVHGTRAAAMAAARALRRNKR